MPIKAQVENAEMLGFGFNGRGGSYHGAFLSTVYNYKKVSLEFRYGLYNQDSKEVPSNYDSGFSILGGNSRPRNRLRTVALLAGWIAPTKTDNKVVLSLKTGVGYNHFMIPEKFTYHSSWLFSGYSHETAHIKNTGWIISPQMAFNLTKHWQLYFAPDMNINLYENLYNFNFGVRINVDVAIISPKNK